MYSILNTVYHKSLHNQTFVRLIVRKFAGITTILNIKMVIWVGMNLYYLKEDPMLPQEQLDRINELVRKERDEGLTDEEKAEQKELREQYIKAFRAGFRNQVEGMKLVDDEGTDVTPKKLKEVQRKKGLHGRSNDNEEK